MFEIYVDPPDPSSLIAGPPAGVGAVHPHKPAAAATAIKTKLTISGYPSSDADITLTPKLHFASYTRLDADIKGLLLSLPGGVREQETVTLSLQYRDEDGDFVHLLPSTYDPQDFEGLSKVMLHAKVEAASSPPSLSLRAAHKEIAIASSAKRSTSRRAAARCALGQRDCNTVPTRGAGGNSSVVKKQQLKPKKATNAAKAPAAVSTQAVGASARRRWPSSVSPFEGERVDQSAVSRVPRFVFSAMSRSPGEADDCGNSISKKYRDGDPASSARKAEARERVVSSVDAVATASTTVAACAGTRGEGQRRTTARASTKPGWNKCNEPAWEEADRKRVAMRRLARARILGKRAAATAKKLALPAGGRGRDITTGLRVIRRAKRDCRVTDARRERLGAYLHHDPIGTPASTLAKRRLETFRELGRLAASTMKYLALPDADSMPKRGRGCGEGLVIFPRGAPVQQPNAPSVSSDVAEKGSLGTSAASARKNSGDNRHDVIPSSTTSAAGKARQSPVSLSAALRQPLARPGDIGFRSGVGVRMRPHSPSRLKPRNPGTIKPYKSTTIDRIGESVKGGGSGRGQRVTKLTAAAAAKVASNADPPAWAGRLRSASSAANSRSGNARPSTRGVWAGGKPSVDEAERKGGEDKAAAAAIMAKLSRKGMIKGKGRGGGCPGSDAGGADNVESLQEQVALLKAAAGVSDEELTWRMETAKPEANAYRIASAALERAETTYERLLWRQGQLQIALARLAGKGIGGDSATSAFATALSRARKGTMNDRTMPRLRSAAEAVLATLPVVPLPPTSASANGTMGATTAAVHVWPANAAAQDVRAAAQRMLKLTAAVEATASTGTEVDRAAVAEELSDEVEGLASRARDIGAHLEVLRRKVEHAVGQVESWQQRRMEAPEFAAEELAREHAWSAANMEANTAALKEMRSLLPEGVWDMKAGDIQAAASAATGAGAGAGAVAGGATAAAAAVPADKKTDLPGEPAAKIITNGGECFYYPSDLCVRLRECRPLHWLVSCPDDIAGANFLAGEAAAAFTQLEGMDLTEMRAIWCVLPQEFARDSDGKKAEWRARFRSQLEGLARQEDRALITAGWDPVRGRRATCRMSPLPSHRSRHPAYFYPTVAATRARVTRLQEQRRRLECRKARLTALDVELVEAKSEVDFACADARSSELRKRYGADTLRSARDAAKDAHLCLVKERRTLVTSVAETERMLSSTYPSLAQLEAEAESMARLLIDHARGADRIHQDGNVSPEAGAASISATSTNSTATVAATTTIRVPGAFSEHPELRRRAAAAARKLTPEEERRLRASEVQRAVSSRDANLGRVPLSPSPAATVMSTAEHAGSSELSAGGRRQRSAVPAGNGAALYLERLLPQDRSRQESVGSDRMNGRTRDAEPASLQMIPEVDLGDDVAVLDECKKDRRVKIAPGVLAFLNKEFSSRTATKRAVGRLTELVPGPVASASAADIVDPNMGTRESDDAATMASSEQIVSAIGDGVTLLPPPPPPPLAAPAMPMSKSLAALLARNNRSGDALGSVENRAVLGGPAAPSLSFLDELRAKGAAKERPSLVAGGVSTGGYGALKIPAGGREESNEHENKCRDGVACEKQIGRSNGVTAGRGQGSAGGPGMMNAAGRGSFLDELKSRVVRLS